MGQLGCHWTDCQENLCLIFFTKIFRENLNFTKSDKNGTLHEDLSTFMICRSHLLRMRNISDKSCKENQNTHFIFNNLFSPRKSCRLWDNVGKYTVVPAGTDDSMSHALSCWRTKATSTHSEYVVLIAIPLQQWLHESASVLRYTYTDCFFFCQLLLHLLGLFL